MGSTTLRWIHRLEDATLALLLASMIGMASTQVILRNFFDTGIAWFDPAVRIMVLWLALLGAVAATRNNEHVSIDALSRFLPKAVAQVTDRIALIFAAAVCGLIGWFSGNFVYQEAQFSSDVFLNVPSWAAQLVIPWAFSIMSFRFALTAFVGPSQSAEAK